MNVLPVVLQSAPTDWDKDVLYNGQNFVLVKVNDNFPEYNRVRNILFNKNIYLGIEKIIRIQHPFAYGRFLLRKLQLENRSEHINMNDILFKITKDEVQIALEYIFDRRRVTYHEFDETNFNSQHYCAVLIKCLRSSISSVKRDCEIYPEYIIYFR